VNICIKSQTISIETDQDACYTVEIVSCTGEAVYKGNIWSNNHHISISGLEVGDYDISVTLVTQKHITIH